jgi:acyl-coenzyme A thioesterase PaaI-like protein
VHHGRRTATTEAELVDGLGRVLATGTSTLLVLAP